MPRCMRCRDGSWECGFRPCAGGREAFELLGTITIPPGDTAIDYDVSYQRVQAFDEKGDEVRDSEGDLLFNVNVRISLPGHPAETRS